MNPTLLRQLLLTRRQTLDQKVLALVRKLGGVMYDVYDPATLFKDAAATEPVKASGDTVGCIKDKGPLGVHMVQATSGSRLTYHESDGKRWVRGDMVDDQILSPVGSYPAIGNVNYLGVVLTSNTTSGSFFGAQASNTNFHRVSAANSGRLSVQFRAGGTQYTASGAANTFPLGALGAADSQLASGHLDLWSNGNLVTTAPANQSENLGVTRVIFPIALSSDGAFSAGVAIPGAVLSASERALVQQWLLARV